MIRRCSLGGCDTVLSRYNKDDRCSLHPHWERTVPLVQAKVVTPSTFGEPRRLEARDFAATIASAFGYSYLELIAPGRWPELVMLRARIAHHLRRRAFSLPEIGCILGRRHSTVINMLRMDVGAESYCENFSVDEAA